MVLGMSFLFGTMVMLLIFVVRDAWIDRNLQVMMYIFKNSVLRNIITTDEFTKAVNSLPKRHNLITDIWHWKIGHYLTEENKQLIRKIERNLLKAMTEQVKNNG